MNRFCPSRVMLLLLATAALARSEDFSFHVEPATPPLTATTTGKLALPNSSTFYFDLAPRWRAGNPDVEFGVSTDFNQRLAFEHRQTLVNGLSIVEFSGFGFNRSDGFFESRHREGAEDSIFAHEARIELQPGRPFTLRLSSGFMHQTALAGPASEKMNVGLLATLAPSDESSIYGGVYRTFDLKGGAACTVLTGGGTANLPVLGLSLNGAAWAVLGRASAGERSETISSGASGTLAWQATSRLWQIVGIEFDGSGIPGADYINWRYFFSSVWQCSDAVSFAFELSYALYLRAMPGQQVLDETRVRLSRRNRIAANFSTELGIEWVVGSLAATGEHAGPALRLAGEFIF